MWTVVCSGFRVVVLMVGVSVCFEQFLRMGGSGDGWRSRIV